MIIFQRYFNIKKLLFTIVLLGLSVNLWAADTFSTKMNPFTGKLDYYVGSASNDLNYLRLDCANGPLTGSLGLTTGTNFTLGTTQWNSGDKIDGTKVADADLGDLSVASGVWTIDAALTTDINIQNVDPTASLTSTDDSNYYARLRRVALNRELSLYNQVNMVAGTPYAFSFDGTDDYVTAGTTSALDFYNSDYSYSFWVYYRGVGEDGAGGTIIGRHDGATGFLFYYKDAAPSAGFWVQENADTWASGVTLTVNTWTHIVLTKSGNTRTIYKNAAPSTTDDNGNYTQNLTTSFEIGTYNDGAQSFYGYVDELGVWNRALTQAEVTALYNTGSGKYGDILASPYSTGFKAGWHADEGTGTVANCFGGSYTGTLTNNATWVTPGPVTNSGIISALAFKSQDGTAAGEEGIQTFGDGQGRTVIDGKDVRFNINQVEKGRFDTSGNFLVGTTTAMQELTVAGDATFSDANPNIVFRDSDDSTATCIHYDSGDATWPGLSFWKGTDAGTSNAFLANPQYPFYFYDTTNSITNVYGAFKVKKTTTFADVLNVDTTNGRVGINMTPSNALDVTGNAVLTGTLAVNGDTISCDGDMTLDPAGNDVILDNANLQMQSGYTIKHLRTTSGYLQTFNNDTDTGWYWDTTYGGGIKYMNNNSAMLDFGNDNVISIFYTMFFYDNIYPGGAGNFNCGDGSNYWNDVSAKTFTDRSGVYLSDKDISYDLFKNLASETGQGYCRKLEAKGKSRLKFSDLKAVNPDMIDNALAPAEEDIVYGDNVVIDSQVTYDTFKNGDVIAKKGELTRWRIIKNPKEKDGKIHLTQAAEGLELTAYISELSGAVRKSIDKIEALEAENISLKSRLDKLEQVKP